jgi:hypothetical protein
MECFNCNKTDECIEKFYSESVTCTHCSEEVEIIYYLCLECGAVWKISGDKVVSGVVFSDKELEYAIGPEVDELFSMLAEDKFFKGDYAKDMDMKEYLANFVPKCIRCESIAYQAADLTYKCSDPECGFEWEVISAE